MLVGKDHCWWERIMLVAIDHVGGEGSCWWERIMLAGKDHCWWKKIMLVAEDHVGGKDHVASWWERIMLSVEDNKFSRIMVSVHEKDVFFAQNGSLSVRSQQKSQQTICQLAADLILWGCWGQKIAPCRDNAEKIRKRIKGCPYILSLNRSSSSSSSSSSNNIF